MSHTVQMRWQDIDALGHVNNAAVLNYFEEGRGAYLRACSVGPYDYVIGRSKVTYIHEIRPESGTVTVECGIQKIGTKSLETIERIYDSDGRLVTEGEFGLVMWDQETRSSRPISAAERAAFEAAMEGGRRPGGEQGALGEFPAT